MRAFLETFWQEILRPLFLRPKRVQVAALCLRQGDDGVEVLMITSRGTGRWILPKGWPINGLDGAEAAAREAWEEAGVLVRRIWRRPVGSYSYDKIQEGGVPEPVHTNLYRIDVAGLADRFPEQGQRERRWMRPAEAAELVDEEELGTILRRY
ncbi:NUDIX hydrolase [Lutimaribacter marinistellae]|uniref:NUDIX hydrolase n=1 Tax=Lutimaribacter marinistellae TaxID=1820329 RepID=A0ABV7TF46_9RHOB